MHCICSLLLPYSFGNATEHALRHSELFLPLVGAPHLTFTLTHSKAGKKERQRCSDANPQTSELPRPCHAVLGPGAQLTATAGLGAADGKRGWAGDFAKTQRLRKKAPRRLLSLPAGEGRAAGGAATQSSDYLLKETNQSLLSTASHEGRFQWKSHWWVPYSAFIFFQLLLEHTEAKCVLGFFCNKPEPQPCNTKSQRLRPNSSHTHPPQAYPNRPPHFCVSIAEVLTHLVGIM